MRGLKKTAKDGALRWATIDGEVAIRLVGRTRRRRDAEETSQEKDSVKCLTVLKRTSCLDFVFRKLFFMVAALAGCWNTLNFKVSGANSVEEMLGCTGNPKWESSSGKGETIFEMIVSVWEI